MAAEGQIGVGATLSMEEIMQRLVDGAQNDLQAGGGPRLGGKGRARGWA